MNYSDFNTRIDIVRTYSETDDDAFDGPEHDIVLAANVWACREKKRGTKFWASKVAVFAETDVMFMFRRIPDVELDTTLVIICKGKRHEIMHVNDDDPRRLYDEVLTKCVVPSKGGS